MTGPRVGDLVARLWQRRATMGDRPAKPFRRTSRCFAVGLVALAATDARAEIALERCLLHDAAETRSVPAKCGRLEVPENDEIAGGETIQLFVAVVPALRKRAEPDAFVPIAGGPGAASSEDYAAWGASAFAEIRKTRDIVLVDQRGTGRSNPLSCPADAEVMIDADLGEIERMSRRCLEQLRGDPRFYTTTIAVRDLERVREALGYRRLDLYGVSYGTRVALQYLRAYPDRVRTVVLDGVVPADEVLGPRIPLAAQRALELIFARCAKDRACQRRFPAVQADFEALARRLAETPASVDFRDPRSGEPMQLRLTNDHLAAVTRLLSYVSTTASLLPLVIDRAAHRADFAPLAGQFTMVTRDLSGTLADGMHAAVVCTEDVPFIEDVDAHALEATYLGPRFVERLRASCRGWPRGVIADDFKTPVRSDRPALLLSGEADPVTPPSNGARALRTLTAAKHVVVDDHGHGVARLGCVQRMITRFVETATVAGLDASCLEHETPAPFFVGPSGPTP